ncbi:hypothetical protein M1N59_01900, partial [Dehalococcoidales bacterium]|nr:hypothetical protein [Dehalococcoidales bacterium]
NRGKKGGECKLYREKMRESWAVTKGLIIFYVIVYFVAAILLSEELTGLSTRVVGGVSLGVWVGMIVIVVSVIVTRLFLTRWMARWLKNNPEEE